MSIINGTLNDDDLTGNSTNNYLFGDEGNDTLSLADRNGILDGWIGDDTLVGNSGNDLLMGYTGNDSLVGGAGLDLLVGEAGDDILNGYGQGTDYEYDYLGGGAGADVFVLGDASDAFYQEAGYAIITDFDSVEADKLQVFGSADDYSLSEFNDGTSVYYQDYLIGYISNTTEISLENDFNFV